MGEKSNGNGSNGRPLFRPWELHEVVADQAGAEEMPPEMEEYHLDCQGKKRLFRLRSYGGGMLAFMEACEIRDGSPTGWRFKHQWDRDTESPPYYQLRQKIAERLSRRDVVREPDGGELMVLDRVIRAQVSCAEDPDAPGPDVLIDGDAVTWEELGQMLSSYERWGPRIEIREQGEE